MWSTGLKEFKLERDVGNEYDRYAVKVSYDDEQLGFIPKKYSEFISKALDDGRVKQISLGNIGKHGMLPYGITLHILILEECE